MKSDVPRLFAWDSWGWVILFVIGQAVFGAGSLPPATGRLATKPAQPRASGVLDTTNPVVVIDPGTVVSNLPLPSLAFFAPAEIDRLDGSFQVDLVLTPPSTNDLLTSVDSLLQFGGSAVAGLDYVYPFRLVLFPAGTTHHSLTISLVNTGPPRPDTDLVLTGILPAPGETTNVVVRLHLPGQNIITNAPPADLSLALTVGPAEVEVGGELVFQLALSNAGPGTTTNVLVRDLLPPGLELLGATSTGNGESYDSGTGAWSIPELAPGETRQLLLRARATAVGLFNQSAEVMASSAPDPDSVPGNGLAAEDDLAFVVFKVDPPIPAPQADLEVEKEAGIEVTLPGGRKEVLISSNPAVLVTTPAVFLLRVKNLGPDEAKNIVVKETLPVGFTLAAVAPPAGTTYNRVNGEWALPKLVSGGSQTLRLDVVTTQLGAFLNRIAVTAATADPVPGNNTAAAPVQVVGASYCGVARLCSSTNTANADAEVTLSQGGKTFRTRTDAQGRFCFENMIPGKYKLRIAGDLAQGIQPIEEDPVEVDGSANVRPFDKEPLVRFFLHEVIRIAGRVTQGGRPVVGQRIIGTGDAEGVVAETDAQGRYILAGFLANETVTVKPGPGPFVGAKFAPAEVKLTFAAISPCELKADFVLTGGLILAGRLQACDKTGPFIPDAEIIVSTPGNPQVAKIRTAADGRFGVTNLPPDTYTLTATHPAYRFANPLGTVKLKAEAKTETFFGQPNGAIAGRILNQDGDGVPGIVVELHQNFRPFGLAASTSTGSDGRFQFAANAAPAGNYVVLPKPNRVGIAFTPINSNVQLGGNACAAYVPFRTREAVAEIVALEVVQVIQDWQNSAPLVAGKPTLVRAFLRAPDGANRRVPVSSVRLVVNGEGGRTTLRPKDGRGIAASNDYLTRRNGTDTSLAFEIPTNRCKGQVTFTLEWDLGVLKTADLPDQTAVRNNATTVVFQDVNELPVLWALVNWTRGGKSGTATLADLARHRSRIFHNLPVNRISPPGKPLPFRWFPPTDPTDDTQAIELGNRIHLDKELHKLAVAIRLGGLLAGKPLPVVRDDLLYGVVAGTAMGGQASGIPGISGFADGSADRKVHRNTPAHEFGHLVGRHHSVNSVYGLIVENGLRIKVGPCKSYAEASAPDFPMDLFDDEPFQPVLGPMTQGIYKRAYGWDAGFNEYVSPFQTPDLMSYCEFKSGWAWPSLTTHQGMFSGIRSRFGPRGAARAAADPMANGPTLALHGELALDGTGAELAPLVVIPDGLRWTEPAPGPWAVRLLDGTGKNLWSQSFSPEIPVVEAGETAPSTVRFELFLPFPNDFNTVEITVGDSVIARYAISPHAPVVTLTGAVVRGDQVQLSWIGTDLDNEALLSTVEYSADDGQTWTPLVADILGSSLELPASQFAGTPAGRFRIAVTDGFHRTTSVPSGALAFPNQPPYVEIESPRDGDVVAGDHELILRADGLDLEDDAAPHFVWQSDRNGVLGTGRELVVETAGLVEGSHQITVTATDSGGLSAQSTIRLTFFHQPGVPLSVRRDGDALVVSWPLAFATWQLRASPAMESPYWYDLESVPEEGAEQVTVRIDAAEDALFLRLSPP